MGPLWEGGELRRTMDRNEGEHFVLLAVEGSEIRAVGEFVREHVDQADVGLVVEDAFQGCGFGRSLFRTMEQFAVNRGIRAFTGDMAYGNKRASAILRGTGRSLQMQVSYGTVQFTLLLEDRGATAQEGRGATGQQGRGATGQQGRGATGQQGRGATAQEGRGATGQQERGTTAQ